MKDNSGSSQALFDEAGHVYAEIGLHRHAGKAICRASSAIPWGGHLHGCSGWLSAPLPLMAALVYLSLYIIRSGYATAGLLYMLADSWVSVLLYCRTHVFDLPVVSRSPAVGHLGSVPRPANRAPHPLRPGPSGSLGPSRRCLPVVVAC